MTINNPTTEPAKTLNDLIELGEEHLYITRQDAIEQLGEEGMEAFLGAIRVSVSNKSYCGDSPCTTPSECSRRFLEDSAFLNEWYALLSYILQYETIRTLYAPKRERIARRSMRHK